MFPFTAAVRRTESIRTAPAPAVSSTSGTTYRAAAAAMAGSWSAGTSTR